MSGIEILTSVVSIIVGGITQVATGIGQGLSALAQNIFLVTTGTGSDAVTTLSTFGILVCVFAGISLALGLCRLVYRWITSLGSRNG